MRTKKSSVVPLVLRNLRHTESRPTIVGIPLEMVHPSRCGWINLSYGDTLRHVAKEMAHAVWRSQSRWDGLDVHVLPLAPPHSNRSEMHRIFAVLALDAALDKVNQVEQFDTARQKGFPNAPMFLQPRCESRSGQEGCS